MDTYSLLRQFADSWMLLALFLFFIGVVVWAFRPGSSRLHRHMAETPLRNDRLPDDSETGSEDK